ncbi:MAG: VOC family protein [Halieaceae bacterium]|nr:VOC family protein [Halieaceae bacterium]MCP5163886.1 VOC family protein [Pseudomonadales bacterium]
MNHETSFGFTKIVVDDLDSIAAFYERTMGFRQFQRVHDTVAGEPIEEIILIHGEQMGQSVPLIVWKWPDRPAPADSDVILGFQTRDLDALVSRVTDAGGEVIEAPHDKPDHGVRVAFARDPEGRLLELVQMLDA